MSSMILQYAIGRMSQICNISVEQKTVSLLSFEIRFILIDQEINAILNRYYKMDKIECS